MNTPNTWIIRRMPDGLAAKFHTNLCGKQITWSADAEATQFNDALCAFRTAIAHGLKETEFYAAAIYPVEERRSDEAPLQIQVAI